MSGPGEGRAEFCPRCGATRLGGYRFCQSCKFDFGEPSYGVAPSSPPQARPVRSSGPLLVLIAFLVVGASAGGLFVLSQPKGASPSATPAASATDFASATATPEPGGLSSACVAQMGPFATALEEVDSRLAVGMNFNDYATKVGSARVAYDRIRFDELDYDCLSEVGRPAEAAYNDYVYAYNVWKACVEDYRCDGDANEKKLQDYWAKSTEFIDRFRAVLP